MPRSEPLSRKLRTLLVAGLCLPVAGCCATDGSCGFTATGPVRPVAIKRMQARCQPHGGIRDWHDTINNPGAMALAGALDFTCNDGAVGTQGWDTQGPTA